MSLKMPDGREVKIGVIGLGYVGLPLATAFGAKYPTVGFDIQSDRVAELRQGFDRTHEVDDMSAATQLRFSDNADDMRGCTVFIVTVPTPIDNNRAPDLGPLISASDTVGRVIGRGDIVIYESTVYPGATEEDCIPVVSRVSELRFNEDFFAGYSPERINPGDKSRPLTSILKVTSGSTPEVAQFVDDLYNTVITAGTFKATSIKVAEAAKITENTQRDVNIALMNELSMVFARLGIDTSDVLDAAATKWNFMRLSPGLVGGHCIGVDPYYLLHRSQRTGFVPDIIRKAREINDGMARHMALQLVRCMTAHSLPIEGARVLLMGATFKENCPDVRNTKAVDLVHELEAWGLRPDIVDNYADADEFAHEYGLKLLADPQEGVYSAVALVVPHREYVANGAAALRRFLIPDGILFDAKAVFPSSEADLRL